MNFDHVLITVNEDWLKNTGDAIELRRWLREIHDTTGHTTVFVTHDQEEALELADRVVVMSQGRIEQVGTADEVYDSPNSPFVYGFIGELSSLPVKVESGQLWQQDRALGLFTTGVPEGEASLYFRPHNIDLTDGCGGCIAGTVAARPDDLLDFLPP